MRSRTPDGRAHAAAASPDAVYRSTPSLVTGVLLLLFGAGLALDAVIEGVGRGPWVAAATIGLLGVLTYALAIRPLVRANATGLLVRNPFRDITVPWAEVAEIRSAYSVEVLVRGDGGRQRRYQLWAVPVSLHARKRANRANVRAAGGNGSARPGPATAGFGQPPAVERALADQVVAELRAWQADHGDHADRARTPGAVAASDAEAAGPSSVRVDWCWPVFAAAGCAALLIALAATIA